jgi:hypothetical protein
MSDTYADGTGGHSGSDTSQARAEREKSDGTHSKRAKDTLLFLALKGTAGATWLELSEFLEIHHGAASGILSNLHKSGRIARLNVRRHRSKVYVLPEFVEEYGGVSEPYGGRKIERDYAIKMVEKVRALHQPMRYTTNWGAGPIQVTKCGHDGQGWPCPTSQIVNGEQS